jgi:hypothetical protein
MVKIEVAVEGKCRQLRPIIKKLFIRFPPVERRVACWLTQTIVREGIRDAEVRQVTLKRVLSSGRGWPRVINVFTSRRHGCAMFLGVVDGQHWPERRTETENDRRAQNSAKRCNSCPLEVLLNSAFKTILKLKSPV